MAAMVEARTALPSEPLNDSYSDDDEPLIALVKKSQTNNMTKSEKVLSKNITRKDSGLDDTSDDEPLRKLVKIPKKAIAQEKRPCITNIKRVAGSTQEDNSYDSSDDEPLINMVKKNPKQTSLPFKKRPFTTGQGHNNVNKGRNEVQKINKICTDSSSSDTSSDMPLNKMVDKLKKATRNKTLSTTRESPDVRQPSKVTKKQRIASSDDSSDYEPLINLSRRSQSQEHGRKVQKQCVTKDPKHGRQTKKKIISEEERPSDDEPLIRLVKKQITSVKKTTATPKKKSTSGKMAPRKVTKPGCVNKALNRVNKVGKSMSEGSSYDSSDDELLIRKTVRNPPMKALMVILERCDTNEVLEDTCGANLGNTGERRAGIQETSSDEQLIKVEANPPPSTKTTSAETNKLQVCSDDKPLINMIGNVQ